MSKSWWALAFVFLYQQTALYNVAQAISQEVASDPILLSLSRVKLVAKTVCPRHGGGGFLLTLCHPGRLAQPNVAWFCHPRQRLLTHSLNSHLVYFIMKPVIESLKDICQRWIKQRTQLPCRIISSRTHIPGFILPTHHFPLNVQRRKQRTAPGTTARKVTRCLLFLPLMMAGASLCHRLGVGRGLFLKIVKSVNACPSPRSTAWYPKAL